eukprot:jgi/Botrbrau1/4645/Bobra.33_2s0016.1
MPFRRGSLFVAAAAVGLLLPGASAFVRVIGNSFVDEDCNEFVFNGYNTWQILEQAAGVEGSKDDVIQQFDLAKQHNFNVVRMFGFGTKPGFGLQVSPGQYNEDAWEAFDFVIDEAGKRGLRLVIALANNWDSADTSIEHRDWANTDNKYMYSKAVGARVNDPDNTRVYTIAEDAFFANSQARQAYKNHIARVVNRVNSINGKRYRDDPTILSWNLINEPRCTSPECEKLIQAWVEEVAPFLKSMDPNHLVTIGSDGFYASSSCQAVKYNPYMWAGFQGGDFLPQHAVDAIDYAAIHLWPDNWRRYDRDFGAAWVDAHDRHAALLNKPVVLEEFGKAVGGLAASDQTEEDRERWFNQTYDQLRSSIHGDGHLKGIMFWRWEAINSQGLGDFDKSASISSSLPAWATVQMFADEMAARKVPVSGCVPQSGGSPASAASSTTPASSVHTQSTRRRRLMAQPSDFVTPTLGAGWVYGGVDGDVFQMMSTTNAAACAQACNSSARCDVWNYCYCEDGCYSNVPRGSCILKSTPNAFFVKTSIGGTQNAGYVGGTKHADMVQDWKCQPATGPCADSSDTCPEPQLREVIKCPTDDCGAEQKNIDGNLLVFDINSMTQQPTVLSAADCCQKCKEYDGCTSWTYCPRPEGCANDCPIYIANAPADKKFGPYGQCQGDHFPYRACSLKHNQDGIVNLVMGGPWQPWVSGVLKK